MYQFPVVHLYPTEDTGPADNIPAKDEDGNQEEKLNAEPNFEELQVDISESDETVQAQIVNF